MELLLKKKKKKEKGAEIRTKIPSKSQYKMALAKSVKKGGKKYKIAS